MRTLVCWLLLGASTAVWTGCTRSVKVARPAEGVEYVVVRDTGMTPQARLLRCDEDGCEEVESMERVRRERRGP
jgi:hypothetical protein